MPSRIRKTVLCVALTGLLPLAVRAQTAADPRITGVVAVEEADSTYGRYRIIIDLAEPLPGGTDASATPEFMLGAEELKVPPGGFAGSRVFGYFDRLPARSVPLRLAWASRAGGPRVPTASELTCDPAALLRASRGGEYEPQHARRTAESFDLLSAWTDSAAVVIARFVAFDIDPEDKNVRLRRFQVLETIRGDADKAAREVTLPADRNFEYELGARYVLFLRDASPSGTTSAPLARLWRASGDPVLEWLRGSLLEIDRLLKTPGSDNRVASAWLDALDNPAAPVRFTAAKRLAAIATFDPTIMNDQQKARIARKADAEPDSTVKNLLTAMKQRISTAK